MQCGGASALRRRVAKAISVFRAPRLFLVLIVGVGGGAGVVTVRGVTDLDGLSLTSPRIGGLVWKDLMGLGALGWHCVVRTFIDRSVVVGLEVARLLLLRP